ncbi:PA14 domain-containing protein [Bacillus toyonensis]|uniref:PA14 domain-containing protein n=1 Tax=Bacillus toyonensis TaxID=155322 RepID=UPI000BF9A683|nr:PA14 domain-containing protein [Bacillus toyonensis]PFY16234.1 galactose oxidase [Bacillus toyonensis]
MNKKRLFVSVSALLLGFFLSDPINSRAEETVEIVTKEDAQSKAEFYLKGISKKSYPEWKEANFSESKTLYDLEGKVKGYVFQVKKENKDFGYIIANSDKNGTPIIESTREGTNPYKGVEEGKAIYTGPIQYLKKEKENVTSISGDQTLSIKEAKKNGEEKELQHNNKNDSNKKNKTFMKSALASDNEEFKKIEGVPDYNWYKGCAPTALANLVAYWDKHGYHNLVADNVSVDQLISNLAIELETDDKGYTYTSKVAPVVWKYFSNLGYFPQAYQDNSPSYDRFVGEIDMGRPLLVSTQSDPFYKNHMMTGVGYQKVFIPELNEEFKELIVHDTWHTTPVDVHINYDQYSKYISNYQIINPFPTGWLTNSIYQEVKKELEYNYLNGSPFGVRNDDFIAKYDQSQTLRAGDYFFQALADDYVRVNFDGNLIIDGWSDSSTGVIQRALVTNLNKGHHYITTAFQENKGIAAIFSHVVPFDSWLAYYYNNKDLVGAPYKSKIIAPQGLEKSLIEDNGTGFPIWGINPDNFSAKYTTVKRLPAGDYIIRGKADDGIRVFVDGKLVIDRFYAAGGFVEDARKITIQDNAANGLFGKKNEKDVHLIEVQYLEEGGNSNLEFNIEPYKESVEHPTWTAEYYNNTELSGTAIVTGGENSNARIDKLNFDWGAKSPGAVQVDNFSARFTKTETFEQGNYYFEAMADDGVRVYVDDKKIIDSWGSIGGNDVRSVTVPITAGDHKVKVEYLELSGNAKLRVDYRKVN